jgi:5-methylcytosine-specific restriction endonuclease McrA
MAQTPEGALKAAATRVGLGVNEYVDRLNAGLLYCWRCQDWHDAEEFGKDASRARGRASSCRKSLSARRKNLARPGTAERRMRKALGQSWCRGCETWLPDAEVPREQGACREHLAAEYRARYLANPVSIRSRVHARSRSVEPMHPVGMEYLTEQFEGACAYCPSLATTWDHVLPVARGGRTVAGNIVPACHSCNSSKNDSDVFEWLERTKRDANPTLFDVLALLEEARVA